MFITLEFSKPKTPTSHEIEIYKKSFVLINEPCKKGNCPQSSIGFTNSNGETVSRSYFNNTNDVIDLAKISRLAGPDAVMLVPFDIDEDGRMDIIIQKSASS